MNLPPEKQKIFDAICSDLEKVEHVSAVVLGGSYASGRANADSDIDIGIYYHENNPFDIQEIQKIAKKYALDNAPTVTNFINGDLGSMVALGSRRKLERLISFTAISTR